MLAIFEKKVAKTPEALQNPKSGSVYALKDGFLQNHFCYIYPGVVTNLRFCGVMAMSGDKVLPVPPRSFEVADDMFCLFKGQIENIPFLKQQYGLTKTATEVGIVIEAYRTLRDGDLYYADQVVRDFQGKFAFMLFDWYTKNVFIAMDADGSVPLYWGTDAEGHLVVSDDMEIVMEGCGKTFAPFPKGCFFTSSGGLRSYEHPLNELGLWCNFKVDSQVKKEA